MGQQRSKNERAIKFIHMQEPNQSPRYSSDGKKASRQRLKSCNNPGVCRAGSPSYFFLSFRSLLTAFNVAYGLFAR
jgi:hypothetical protein